MDLITISVGALSTLVIGMSGIIWSVVSKFVTRDEEWKRKHSAKVNDNHKELNDRLTQLEVRMIKEVANYSTQMQKQVTHLEKELQQISNDLQSEYADIVMKVDKSDLGKVYLLEERVHKISSILQAILAEQEIHRNPFGQKK